MIKMKPIMPYVKLCIKNRDKKVEEIKCGEIIERILEKK